MTVLRYGWCVGGFDFDTDQVGQGATQEEEVKRPAPIRDVAVGKILGGAFAIEPAKWTMSDQMRVGAWLKSRNWERYQCRNGDASKMALPEGGKV